MAPLLSSGFHRLAVLTIAVVEIHCPPRSQRPALDLVMSNIRCNGAALRELTE
jgi:hypothetical protein